MKNFILIIIIFALSNCEYTPVYKNMDKDNPKILIKSIQGDNSINKILKRKLKRYELNESKRIFNLEAKTSFSKIVLSKDKTGRATDLKLSTKIEFIVVEEDKKRSFSFEESLIVKNSSDFSEQTIYENNIKDNFVDTILAQLVFNLKTLK